MQDTTALREKAATTSIVGEPDPTRKRLWNSVRQLREQRGLSRADLAARAGLTAHTLMHIELGDKRPSTQTGQCIARALGVKLERVFVIVECPCGDCGLQMIDDESGRALRGHHAKANPPRISARGLAARRRQAEVPETKTCLFCGKAFARSDLYKMSLAVWLNRKYCSDCGRRPIEKRPCVRCGRSFKPRNRNPRERHCSLCSYRGAWLTVQEEGGIKLRVQVLKGCAKGLRGQGKNSSATAMLGRHAVEFAKANGKKPGRKLTIGESEEREVVERFKLGESRATIADAMSMTGKQVRGVLKRNGLAS